MTLRAPSEEAEVKLSSVQPSSLDHQESAPKSHLLAAPAQAVNH
ncbi:hypothetical protein K239x_34000 [Planctomycetes bacterium K23_9]|uniref:Uncharacterized protein n=1 Tax=Stieleria marina TaxID=1930275 RepID=A0A517NWA5_9BACT|nr:hypothetical protein K239x_34000 [Planctomycetes bacterium K23_9]